MSSMTDIVFLLLIFFLVTSTLVNPNALKLLLPKANNQESKNAAVSISIKDHSNGQSDGPYTYHLNEELQPLELNEIEAGLVELLQDSEDPMFSINADESVPIKEVVLFMNIAKKYDYKVIMATRAE